MAEEHSPQAAADSRVFHCAEIERPFRPPRDSSLGNPATKPAALARTDAGSLRRARH